MDQFHWMVIKCPFCQMCHGSKKKSERCQHCGKALGDEGLVVDTASTAAALQVKVALENTPVELRDTLQEKLGSSHLIEEINDEPSLTSLYASFHRMYNNIEQINLSMIKLFLTTKASSMMPETFVGHLISQGLIIETSDEAWQFIE